jgi:hypothetical protein
MQGSFGKKKNLASPRVLDDPAPCGLMQSWSAATTSFASLVGLRRAGGVVMDVGNSFLSFLMQLATRAPSLLVYFVGIAVAIALWRRYPKPCLLVFLAMCLALFAVFSSTFLFMYLPRAMDNLGGGHQEVGIYFSAINIVSSLIHAAAVALLLSAVFVGRSQPPPRPRWNADDDRTVEQHPRSDTRIQG